MLPKRHKSAPVTDSVKANPSVRKKVKAMFENSTITASTAFRDIYDEHEEFHLVNREKFRRWFNTVKRWQINLSKFLFIPNISKY